MNNNNQSNNDQVKTTNYYSLFDTQKNSPKYYKLLILFLQKYNIIDSQDYIKLFTLNEDCIEYYFQTYASYWYDSQTILDVFGNKKYEHSMINLTHAMDNIQNHTHTKERRFIGEACYVVYHVLGPIIQKLLLPVFDTLDSDDILPKYDLFQEVIISIFDILDLIYFYSRSLCWRMYNDDVCDVIQQIFSDNKYYSIIPIQRTNTSIFIPTHILDSQRMSVLDEILDDREIEIKVPPYNSFTFQMNVEQIENYIIQYYTTNDFSYMFEQYQQYQEQMTYKKYRIVDLFNGLYYTPDLSETNVKVFKFDIQKQSNLQNQSNLQTQSNLQKQLTCAKCQKQTTPSDSFIYDCCDSCICSECVKRHIFPYCMIQYPDEWISYCPCCDDIYPYKTIYV